MNNRIKEIEEMIKNEPEDPFLRYALALEYFKKHDNKKAAETFKHLLSHFPDYLPTYYQAAHFFHQQEKHDKVHEIYKAGIQLAEKTQDLKTLRELRSAYEQFIFETEEDL